MIPIGDENPTFRQPIVTYVLLAAIFATWFFVQGAGFEPMQLAASARNVTVTTAGGTSGAQTFTITAAAEPQEVPIQP